MTMSKLFYKDNRNQSSSSKFWFSITNTVVLTVYAGLGWNLIKSAAPDLEGWAILTLVIVAVVTSNKFANELIKLRYGAGGNSDASGNSSISKKNTTTDSIGSE